MGSITQPIQSLPLPALQTSPKIIFFTDYDGTITQQDSNDFLTDTLGFGVELRRKGNEDVLWGRRHFRDNFRDMMDSIRTPYDRCIELLLSGKISIDPYFIEFYRWCRENNVPVVILSGGMRPIIRAMLAHWLGDEEVDNIQIVSNDVAARPGMDINDAGGWQITFHDDSSFGHDKSLEIRPYANLPSDQRPILLYAGDGVSDLSAAKETDLLFAKAGKDLVTYCEKEGVPFATFEDFSTIFATVRDIAAGKLRAKGAATGRK